MRPPAVAPGAATGEFYPNRASCAPSKVRAHPAGGCPRRARTKRWASIAQCFLRLVPDVGGEHHVARPVPPAAAPATGCPERRRRSRRASRGSAARSRVAGTRDMLVLGREPRVADVGLAVRVERLRARRTPVRRAPRGRNRCGSRRTRRPCPESCARGRGRSSGSAARAPSRPCRRSRRSRAESPRPDARGR